LVLHISAYSTKVERMLKDSGQQMHVFPAQVVLKTRRPNAARLNLRIMGGVKSL
jgi:hypothetical protein